MRAAGRSRSPENAPKQNASSSQGADNPLTVEATGL